jgi:hypothetical protein
LVPVIGTPLPEDPVSVIDVPEPDPINCQIDQVDGDHIPDHEPIEVVLGDIDHCSILPSFYDRSAPAISIEFKVRRKNN